jgi:hypothetical protein
MAVRAKILFSDAPRVDGPDIPKELADLVARMLARPPLVRPADAAEVAAAIATLPPLSSALRPPRPKQELTSDSPTRVVEPPDLAVSLVFVCEPLMDEDETPPPPPDLADLTRASEPFHGEVSELAGGGHVVKVTGEPAKAARCALALRGVVPNGSTIVLTIERQEDQDVHGETIDRGVRMVQQASLGDSFAPITGGEEGTVWVDARTADLLQERFELKKQAQGFQLRGERAS